MYGMDAATNNNGTAVDDDELLSRLRLDAESVDPWITALIIVRFDLDAGPVVDCIYPTGAMSDTLAQTLSAMVRIFVFSLILLHPFFIGTI